MFNLFMLIGCWIVYGIMKAHEKAELARKLPPKPTKQIGRASCRERV